MTIEDNIVRNTHLCLLLCLFFLIRSGVHPFNGAATMNDTQNPTFDKQRFQRKALISCYCNRKSRYQSLWHYKKDFNKSLPCVHWQDKRIISFGSVGCNGGALTWGKATKSFYHIRTVLRKDEHQKQWKVEEHYTLSPTIFLLPYHDH